MKQYDPQTGTAHEIPTSLDTSTVQDVLVRHAAYSFDPIGWDWNQLTPDEKTIVGSPEVLGAIKIMVEYLERGEP